MCDGDGVTYFSPCHAGCSSQSSKYYGLIELQNSYSAFSPLVKFNSRLFSGYFGGCSCTARSEALQGACPPKCGTLVPFMVVLFLSTLLVAATQMPLLMVVLRSVREEEKAFALGIQFVIFRLFGYIPRLLNLKTYFSLIYCSSYICISFSVSAVRSSLAMWSTPPACSGKRLAAALMGAASSMTLNCFASSMLALALLSR